MTVVAVQLIVQFIPEGSALDLETEVAPCTTGLYPTMDSGVWFSEELQEGFQDTLVDEALTGKSAGWYSVIALAKIEGGRTEDTPAGPGEGWSMVTTVGTPHVCPLSRRDLEEMSIDVEEKAYTEAELLALFGESGLQPAPAAFQFQAAERESSQPGIAAHP